MPVTYFTDHRQVRGYDGLPGGMTAAAGQSVPSATRHLSATCRRSGGVGRAAARRTLETASSVVSTLTRITSW